jgi:hypothetical protein
MNAILIPIIVSVFVAVHVSGHRLHLLDRTPRSVWLSAAGGISVAYVFLHLLPELARGQRELQAVLQGVLAQLERHVYLVALAGITMFYGLERLALGSRRRSSRASVPDQTEAHVFALHVGSFALYNLLIGYLLVHGEQDDLFFYAVAMALHLLVNDHAMRQHHRQRYDRTGRWLLAAAVLGGWLLGRAYQLPPGAIQLLVALLAGGVILNVVKEELPQERDSRFSAFLAGVVLYGALLLLA